MASSSSHFITKNNVLNIPLMYMVQINEILILIHDDDDDDDEMRPCL